MTVRPYHEDSDLGAVHRIWQEIGWVGGDKDDETAVRSFYSAGDAVVAELDGDAECAVHRTPGTFRYLDVDVPLSAITAVTTSHVARKQSLASALTAETLAAAREAGAAVSVLGMFEQGFYNRFGFGSGPYDHWIAFDPARLTVPVPTRPPARVGLDQLDEVHELLLRRQRGHGGVTLTDVANTEAELRFIAKRYGLGFRDPEGRLTHFVLGSLQGEHEFHVSLIAYETSAQLLELFGLLRGLGDQFTRCQMREPAELQVQDLMETPMRERTAIRLGGGNKAPHTALAWWQLRILDLERCIEAVQVAGAPLEFDLVLTDPLAERGGRWPGIGGDWTIRLGEESSAIPRSTGPRGPVLRASVNALSRLWAGVRPATSLALTDELDANPELLGALDRAFRLPLPRTGIGF